MKKINANKAYWWLYIYISLVFNPNRSLEQASCNFLKTDLG